MGKDKARKIPYWKRKLHKDNIALVLPHTFFHDTFRFYIKGEYEKKNWLQLCYTRFISTFIIEKQSWLPDEDYSASTSDKSIKSFNKIFEESGLPTVGAENLITIFRSVLKVRDEPDINKLTGNGPTIAIANDMYQFSKYDPVVIANPGEKNNFIKETMLFYKKPGKRFKAESIPFLILEAKEVIGLLKQRDPSVYKTTLGLTPDPFRLYIEELDAEFEAHPCKFE